MYIMNRCSTVRSSLCPSVFRALVTPFQPWSHLFHHFSFAPRNRALKYSYSWFNSAQRDPLPSICRKYFSTTIHAMKLLTTPFAPLLTLLALAILPTTTLAATPPAYLLSAVNQQANPANLNAICGDDARQVQDDVEVMCSLDGDRSVAQKAFLSTCREAGMSVGEFWPFFLLIL